MKFFKLIYITIILLFFGIISYSSANSLEYEFDDSIFTGEWSLAKDIHADLHFNRGGNDFGGKIFFKDIVNTGETFIQVDTYSKTCYRQIRGFYFNSARGNRIWPLDQDSLAHLQSIDSSYNSLATSGGLFICDDEFNTYESSSILGSINHNWSGLDYRLFAGPYYDFGENNYIFDLGFTRNLFFEKSGSYYITTGYLWDSVGGIASVSGYGLQIDTAPPSQVVLNLPISGMVLNHGNVELEWDDAIDTGGEISGYYYEISTGIDFDLIIESGYNNITGTTTQFLFDNIYYRKVYAIDKENNTGVWSDIRNFTITNQKECDNSRNNNYFITGAFRQLNPTNQEIICALYGSGNKGTAYTQNRSGWDGSQCSGEYIGVIKTNELPNSLQDNYIYIVSNNNILENRTINIGRCNTIISSNISGTQFEKVSFRQNSYFDIINNNIFDNISLKGSNNGIYIYSGENITITNTKSFGQTIYNISDYSLLKNIESSGGYIHIGGTNNIIEEIKVHDTNRGLALWDATKNNKIKNIETYNNRYGICISNGNGNKIENVISYNNERGIHIERTNNTTINNGQFFNNNQGIRSSSYTYNNVINNVDIYNNNLGVGIGIFNGSAQGIIFNDVNLYNNNIGIKINSGTTTSSGHLYYGELNIFSNLSNFDGTNGTDQYLKPGTGNLDYLGRNTGEIAYDGIISWNIITNPLKENGKYLFNRKSGFNSLIGYPVSTGKTILYSYGSGISLKKQPVLYSGTTLITGGYYNSEEYIGSKVKKVTGDLDGNLLYGLQIVTGISNNDLIDYYSIFGDLNNDIIGTNISTSTGIDINSYNGKLITQLWGTNYFATHFEVLTNPDTIPPTKIELISPISGSSLLYGNISLVRSSAIDTGVGLNGYYYEVSTGIDFTYGFYSGFTENTGKILEILEEYTYYWRVYAIDNNGNTGDRSEIREFEVYIPYIECHNLWDNDNFITGAFWDLDPNTGNVICALYGSGPGDTTAYTRYRSGWNTTQCSGVYMNVIYTNNLDSIQENTIYITTGSEIIRSSAVDMKNCSTVISRNTTGTEVKNVNSNIFYMDGKKYSILDNISSTGNGNYKGYFMLNSSSNNTLNNIKSKNNDFGILIGGKNPSPPAENNLINNVELYNNNYGIQLKTNADRNIINNSNIYNNKNRGIDCQGAFNNIINNTKIFNNNYFGIYLNYCSHFNINNTVIKNNNIGLSLYQSMSNITNNSFIYNNNVGIDFQKISSQNLLNNTKIFNNQSGLVFGTNANKNKYYGNFEVFGNINNFIGSDGKDTKLTGGLTEYQYVGWTTGFLIETGNVSWDMMTNIIGNNGEYLLNRSSNFNQLIGTGNLEAPAIGYSFGNSINLQEKVFNRNYNRNTILSGLLTHNVDKYIGSDLIKVTGDLIGPTEFSNKFLIVTGISNSSLIEYYNVFGSVTNKIQKENIGNSTGIELTGDIVLIITQLRGDDYFATHFEEITTIDETGPEATMISGSVNENESCTIYVSGAYDTGAGLDNLPYARSTDGTNFGVWTGNTGLTFEIENEPTIKTGRVMIKDALGNTGLFYTTCTWQNIPPSSENLYIIGEVGTQITFNATGTDPGGTTFSYQRYSGNSCNDLITEETGSNFFYTANTPTTLERSYKVFDAQGSGSECAIATGIWNNSIPSITSLTGIFTKLESETISVTVSGYNPIGGNLDYYFYSGSCPGGDVLQSGTDNIFEIMFDEPSTLDLFIRAENQSGVSSCTGINLVWTNTGPINIDLINDSPKRVGNEITRTGSAFDTGNNLVYERFSGYNCEESLNRNGIGSDRSTTGSTLDYSGSLARSVEIFDTQGSGGICLGKTGVWNSEIPIAEDVVATGYENETIYITGTMSGTILEPVRYIWYDDSSCASQIQTGQTYSEYRNEPGTEIYYYKIFNSGEESDCTTGTITWTNITPTAQNLFESNYVGNKITFNATGTDPGGTIFSYQWFSGNICSGDIISTGDAFSYTGINPGTIVRSYKLSDVQGNGDCVIATGERTYMSCSLPRGGNIDHGQSITVYESGSVACGSSCVSGTLICDNGSLTGDTGFTNQSCSVDTCDDDENDENEPYVSNGGGGGGSRLYKDHCPEGDYSDSYYDGSCGSHGSATNVCGVNDSNYSDELKGAYLYSYSYGITNMCPVKNAGLDRYLYRDEYAKMISEFAMKILGKEPNIGKAGCDNYSDIENEPKDLQYSMKTACELELMGLHSDGKTPKDGFDPNQIVTRAEFGTVFSRLLFGDKHNVDDESDVYKEEGYRFRDHLKGLKERGVMTKIDGEWPYTLEMRGRAMLMLQRADYYGLFYGKIPAQNGIKALFGT